MAWYPTRISTRLTIGGILLLAVTTIVIVVIMLWRGQPRVVEINTALIEETGQGLTRQLSTVLSRIEGETVSMSRLAEVLPNDESLYQSVVPHLIGEGKDSIITGGGIWPEPDAFTAGVEKRSFSGRVMPKESLSIPTIITSKDQADTTMKAGISTPKGNHKTTAYGLMFTRMPVQASTW